MKNEAYEQAKKSNFYECKTCKGKGESVYKDTTPAYEIRRCFIDCPTCKGTGIYIDSEILYVHMLSECSEAHHAFRKDRFAPTDFIHSIHKNNNLDALWQCSFDRSLKGTFEMEVADIYIIIQSACGYFNIEIEDKDLKLRQLEVPENNKVGFVNYCLLEIEKSIMKSSYHKDRAAYLTEAVSMVLSLAAALDIPLQKYIEVKMKYNTTRPLLHEEKANA